MSYEIINKQNMIWKKKFLNSLIKWLRACRSASAKSLLFEKQRDAQNKIRVQKLSGYKIETDDDIKEIVKELIKT